MTSRTPESGDRVIVVSDTSPLNYLLLINAIHVLPDLFDEVYVPAAVMGEMQQPRTPEPVKLWAQSPPVWLKVRTAAPIVLQPARLGPGEAEAYRWRSKTRRCGAILY